MAEETNMEQTPMENNEPVTPPVDVAKVEETPVEPAPKVEPVAPVEPVAAAPVAPEPVKPVQEAKSVQPKPAPVAKKPAPVKEAPVEKPIDIAQKKNQFKDAVLSTKDVSEWSYNYDRGSEKKGKDPYSYQKVFKPIPSNKLGEGLGEFASTKTERALNKDYASPSRDEFDEMASNSLRVLYKQGAWDKYKDSPNFMTSYINNYVNRVSTKNGYYLSDDDKKLLAQRILNDEYPKFNSLAKNIIPAIDRSGIVNRVIEENRGAQNKLAEALSSATSDIKTESQRISTQVNDFYRNDIDKLKSETDAAKKDVQDYTQSLYDSYVGEEYTKRVNTIQQAVNTNNLSIEEARKMVEPGEDGLSPLLREVVDYTNNNAEYIAKRDSYAKEKQDQINKQAYDLNSRMKSDYDTQMNPVYTKVDSNYKKTFDSIQSQVGFTKEDMDKFQRALGQIAKEDQDKEYVRSKSLAESAGIYDLMSSMYLGGGVIAEEFRRGFVGGARDLVTDMYSNLTGRFVNELDFQNVKERISGQGINASLLYERDGLSAAFNPAVIAGTVGQQLPVLASTLVPGLATGTMALNAGKLMNLSKWGLNLLAGSVGGATEFAVVGEMVRDEARAQALSTGASPDQVREAERIATNTWLPSAPLYFLQVGALLSPALSFTKKAGTELVTEFTTEHWEGISGTVGVESVIPELNELGVPTGNTQYKGLSSVISEYVSSPEFLATSAATIWTTAIVGTAISALGSKPKAKIVKATIFDMFSKAGRIVPDAMLDQNLKAGKITQAQYEEGMAKVNAMQSAINKVSDMDISDDITVYASVDKLYDINILEAKVQATQDPDVKETLTAQLDQAKKELKDITMGKSGVYIRENPGTGPMVMTKQDMDQALNDPEVISAIESNAVRFRVANDNDMVAKLNDAVDGYKKTWKAKVDQMTQTSTEGGRMTVNEAYELAELQTQQEMLTKTGRQLEPEKTARMMELSAKGSVNLAAYERRAQESAKLKGSTPSFVEKAKKAMSKAFPNSTVVSDLEGFIAAATDAIKSSKQASNVVYDAPSKSFIVEYTDRENETIKLSQVSGFNAGGGKIFINPLNKSLDTIVHELGGHSWVNELLAKSNVANVAKPEGGSFTLDEIFNADDKDLNEEARRLKEGLSLMRETDYYEELKLNPFYANKSEASILEEALVQAIGEKGALKIKKTKANADGTISVDPTRLEKIVNWIKDFIKSITGKEAEPGQELADYINSALKDILGTEKLDAEISQAEADRLAQPSGFTDADGNPLNNREVNFMVRNDLIVDVANDVRFNYIKDSDQFKRLLEGDPGNGIAPSITIDKTLSDFAGQTMVLHVPDNSFTGQIFKGEDKVVDGKGGIYYVVRFNDKGYFWASTKGGASVFVNFLNEVRANSKDGKIRMGLVSANQDKLLSSTLNSNAILDIMYSKAFDERVKLTPRQVSSAYVYGINYAKDFINTQIDSKAKKENWSASKIKEEKAKVIFPKILKGEDPISVQNKLKEFFAADVSSFEARKQLNIGMLKGISNEAKVKFKDKSDAFKNFSSQFLDFFGELTGNPKIKSTGGKISGSNLEEAISNFLTEPLLKGQQPGNIYAVIEIDGEVEAYDTTGDAEVHESYPIAIRSKEGNKPTLHILQDRQGWMDNSIDLETGEKVTKDNKLSVLPANRGLSRPIKLADDIKKIEIPKDQVRFSVKDDAAKPVGRIFTTPHYAAETVANDYVVDNGLPPIAKTIVRVIDVDRAMKIADAYDAMSDMSNDPDTIAGYKQMGEESVKQFDHMVNNGYTVEVYTKDGEPYATAADMIKDLNENKHLYILATKEDAFGQEGDFQKAQGEEKAKSPLLETSGRFDINGYELLNNDVFRAVHDFFGHAVMGNSFGPVGEENAWLIHSQMYSPLARRAMTSETRMQNSWVNFNRKMRTVEVDGALETIDTALQSVEATAKALEGVDKQRYKQLEFGSEDVSVRGVKFSDIFIGDALLDDLISNLNEQDKRLVKDIFSRGVDYFEFNDAEQKTWEDKFTNPEDFQEVFDMLSTSELGRSSAYQNYNDRNYANVKDAIRYILQNKNEYSGELVSAVEKINNKLENPKNSMQRLYAVDIEANLGFSKSPKQISEAYHKAKADGSNPELVSSVEKTLGVGRRPAKVGEPGYVPLSKRKFAEQKNILSPDWVVDTDVYLKQEPIVGDDTQAKFSVKDDHFPKDKNVNAIRNSKIYSQLVEDGNGNFVFFHASPNQKLDKLGINPDKFGMNVLKTSAEERMRSVSVSMYYVNENTDVKYTSKYFVKIPKNKVYYFNQDALKLAPKAKKAFEKQAIEKGYNLAYTPNEQVGYMLLEARKLGYEMIIAKWGNSDVRAETNILMKPTKYYDLDGNVVKYVTRERFMTNKDRLRGKKIPKSDILASERDYRWYEKKVDQLPSADISKDEFMDMMQTGKFVIMTPENPNNSPYFEYENDNLISDFEDEMIRGEFNYIPIIGRYGNYERSFIITDVKQSDVKRLAKQFNQESVAADFGIYYPAKKSFYPRVKTKDSFMDGEMSRDDDFMSTIMTTDGPITFALNYDFEQEKKSGAKFQVVGIQGARNVNGLITNYNSALKMEKKGMSSKQIYAATGWFRDFAGNMAYEIDDANAEIKMYPTSEALPLSDILDHPLLYEMYPFAKNIRVKSYEGDGNEAYFIIDSNGGATIGINSEYVKPDDKEKLYVNLMHEIQHYIQKKEGFDSGSSIDMSVQRLEWIRDSITKMNKAIGKGDYKIPNKQLDRYLKGINIDLSIISTVSNVIKDENDKKKSTLAYWFDYGEMTARYSETPLLQKNIQSTPTVDILGMAEGIAALSTMRVMNIHDAFFNKTGKITTGPGQRINIPGFKVEDDIQRKQIINEKIARGISMKAAANYYAGVKETEEEKEARLLLRDQLMLEIMAAKQAYEQRSSEAAQAALYEARKRDIEEAFRVKDMEDRVSTKLNRKIRREQILSAFRWLGEKEKWQDKIANWEGMKQLIFDRIEEYRKDGSLAGKINGRTLSTFSKMILNATTEKRLNRALAYLDKALEDKQYGELVGNIRDLKATIKQMIRGGKNPFGNYYDSVVELISYDESNLFNPYGDRSFATMELYRDMLEQLARKDMPNFKAYMNDYHLIQDVLEASVDNEIADQTFNEVKTASELNKYIDQFFAAPINNEIDFMAIRKIASAINKRATELYSQGVISADEFAQIFAKISKGSKSEDIEQLEVKNKVRAMEADMFTFAAYRMNLLSEDQFSGDNKAAFKKLRGMLNNPQGIENFRNAGTDAIILLEKIVDQLENGFMSYRIYELINTVEVQASAKSMVEEISKTLVENETKPFRRKLSPSAIKIASDLTGMPKQIVDQALGLGKTRTFYNNIASKLGFSFSALRSSNKELGRTVYKSLQRFGGLMSMPELERYRVGLIMKQLDYQSNIPNFETSEVIKDVTKYLLSDKASELDPKELKAIAKAYESLPKNANGDLDVDAALASLSKREKNLYDTARDLFDKHLSPKVAATNFRRGEIADNQTNYYRRFSQGVRSSEIGDSMTPEEIVRNMETYKIRSGSTMGRVSNGLYWTVIDPESVLFRSINDVNTDYYLSNSVPKSFTVLREASKKAKGQTKAIIDALAILTKDTLVDELTINRRVANPAGLFSLDGMMTRASNQARNLLLSNPTRVVTELIPSVTKYLISEVNIDQLRTFLSSDKSKNAVLYKRLLYDLHLPFKDNITRFALEGGDAGRQSMLSATADAVATFSDALFSKGIFNIAFDESFKNLTGEDFDIERYYNDPQYAAGLESLGVLEKAATDGLYKAERLASSLTQFTTPLSVGFSSRSSAAAKVFGFMMSYNAFESKTFFENLRDVITGENEGRIAGARYTAGVITSNTMYIMLGYFMNQLFKELDFDDDDPIEEEIMNAMKATTDKKSAGNLLMASVANLIVGGYGVSFKLGLGFLIGLYDSLKLSGYSIDKEISDIADEVSAVAKEYAYVSGINFSDRYGATSISDATSFIPLFGIYLTPAIEGLDFVAAYDKKSRGEEVSNEEELNYRLAIALHALANFAGLQYPGIGLVHKKLKSSASSEAKKAKARKEYEKEMKSMEKSSAPQLPAVDSLQSEIQYEVPEIETETGGLPEKGN